MTNLRIVIAPSAFKASLSAEDVTRAIEIGVRAACPTAQTIEMPIVSGGEGFTAALVRSTGGIMHPVRVTGPVGQVVETAIGILGGAGPHTAVIEMAAAAGLRLVPGHMRNPLITTTYGVGQMIKAALNIGVERILIGCGDAGTNDGGAGMAQALGARLLRADGTPIAQGGLGLAELDRIDLSDLDPCLAKVQIDVACHIHNILCGPQGVARVYGPKKGASPAVVEQLAQALDHYAEIIKRDLGDDVAAMPGGGASGGLGAGLYALLGARLHPSYTIVIRYLDSLFHNADLVITAEDDIDGQTPRGSIPTEVARHARRYGLPVITLAGSIGYDARVNYNHGIAAFMSIMPTSCTPDQAVECTFEWTANCAENVMRMVLAGRQIAQRPSWPMLTPHHANNGSNGMGRLYDRVTFGR